MHRLLPAVVACLLPIAAVAQTHAGCDDLSGRPLHPQVNWQDDVKPILVARCNGCHNGLAGGGGLDLTDSGIDAIYKIVNGYHVVPGRPSDSQLFLKVNCAMPPFGTRMPDGGEPLSILQQELIHDWIAQGAPGEPASQPIQRQFVFRDGLEGLR